MVVCDCTDLAGRRLRRRVALFLPSLEGGGAERVTLNLAEGLAERGFPTDLVLAAARGPLLDAVSPAVRVVDLRSPRTLTALRPLVRYLRQERPHALLAALDNANLVAMVARRLAGTSTRTVISIHTTIRRATADLPNALERAVPRLVVRLQGWADRVIAVSEGAAVDFAAAAGIPRSRVDVVHNAIITPGLIRAAREAPQHPWFADRGCPVVLGVGRLAANKNFRALVEAFALVRGGIGARLVILGEGPDRRNIEACVRGHGLADVVALPGFLANPYPCIARAAVVVLSSDWEGLPTVLVESLALGTPVVSTDCPSGPREILQGGRLGRLVQVGDVAAMGRAIAEAIAVGRQPPPTDALRAFLPEVVLDSYERVLGLAPHA